MSEDVDSSNSGVSTLFTKTLLVLYTSLLAFASRDANGSAIGNGTDLTLDSDFLASMRTAKRRPQLVLKLNVANPAASMASMHTSHRSHSSHNSHYSSSSSGHSSHSSHSSHYSSASYSPAPTRSYSPSTSKIKVKTKRTRRAGSGSTYTATPGYRYTASESTVYVLGERVLKLGDRGADVKRLQELLAAKGYSVTPDGQFGLGTNAAVKAFQTARGLTADGIVGYSTIVQLQLP